MILITIIMGRNILKYVGTISVNFIILYYTYTILPFTFVFIFETKYNNNISVNIKKNKNFLMTILAYCIRK